jgi:hypothetical protein
MRGKRELNAVSIAKPRPKELNPAELRAFITEWSSSNRFSDEDTFYGTGYENSHGHKLARLIHGALIDLGFPVDLWSEESRIKIAEWTVEALEECSNFEGLEPEDTIEAALHYWDSIKVPMGCELLPAIAARAMEMQAAPPGSYLKNKGKLCKFLWHVLQLLPDDDGKVDVKYLSCRKAAEVALAHGLVESKEAGTMAVSRAYQTLCRNGVLQEVQKGQMGTRQASRFKLLQR